jgi:hypothetical protein
MSGRRVELEQRRTRIGVGNVEDEREEASTTECARAAWRVQAAIVAFFALAAASVVVIYIAAPSVYVQVLTKGGAAKEARPPIATAFMIAILLFVAALTVGVLRRWRWLFWLVLLAFGFSVLQIPAGALELAGIIPSSFPTWHTVYRALVAVPEVAIAVAMVGLWRRCGVWGNGRRNAKPPGRVGCGPEAADGVRPG